MRKLLQLIIQLRYFFPGLIIHLDGELRKDLIRWKEIQHMDCPDRKAMAILLWRFKEFRNLVVYRQRASDRKTDYHVILSAAEYVIP